MSNLYSHRADMFGYIFALRCTSSKSLTISLSITEPSFSILFRLDIHDFLMHVDGVRKTRDVKFLQSSCRHFQIFLHIDVRVVSLRLVSLSITEPSVSSGNVRVGDLPCFAENMQLSRWVAGQAEGCFSKALFLMRFLDCYSKV